MNDHRLPIPEVRKIAKKLNLFLSSKTQRVACFERDKGVCAGCGETATEWNAEHIFPLHAIPPSVEYPERLKYWAVGNLQTLGVSCGCHQKKSRGEVIANAKVKRIQKRLAAHKAPEGIDIKPFNIRLRTARKFLPRAPKQIN